MTWEMYLIGLAGCSTNVIIIFRRAAITDDETITMDNFMYHIYGTLGCICFIKGLGKLMGIE